MPCTYLLSLIHHIFAPVVEAAKSAISCSPTITVTTRTCTFPDFLFTNVFHSFTGCNLAKVLLPKNSQTAECYIAVLVDGTPE